MPDGLSEAAVAAVIEYNAKLAADWAEHKPYLDAANARCDAAEAELKAAEAARDAAWAKYFESQGYNKQ